MSSVAPPTPWADDSKCFLHSSASFNISDLPGCKWKLGCHVRQGMIFGRLRSCCQQNVIHCPLKCWSQQVRRASGVDQWVVALFKCFKCLPHRQQLLQWNSTGALLNMLQNRCYFTIYGKKVPKYWKCQPAIPHVTSQNWSCKVWVCNNWSCEGVFIPASPTQPPTTDLTNSLS